MINRKNMSRSSIAKVYNFIKKCNQEQFADIAKLSNGNDEKILDNYSTLRQITRKCSEEEFVDLTLSDFSDIPAIKLTKHELELVHGGGPAFWWLLDFLFRPIAIGGGDPYNDGPTWDGDGDHCYGY